MIKSIILTKLVIQLEILHSLYLKVRQLRGWFSRNQISSPIDQINSYKIKSRISQIKLRLKNFKMDSKIK